MGLIITKTEKNIIVDCNDLIHVTLVKKVAIPYNSIVLFQVRPDSDQNYLDVFVNGTSAWQLCTLAQIHPKALPVESINGVTPVNNTNLFELLSEL